MKKILALLLIGGIVMTTLIGCKNVIFGKSKDEIEDLFVDFMSVFQSENYDFLYEKEGDPKNLPEGDLGCWKLYSSMNYFDGDNSQNKDILLVFNKNIKQCRGFFWLNDEQYPINYIDGEILFIDEHIDINIKTELEHFPLMFNIINLSKAYLNTLENKRYYYNFEVPLYGADYYLPVNDTNRDALKKSYSDFSFHEVEDVLLKLEGQGSIGWNTNSNSKLSVYYTTETGGNLFTAGLAFSSIESFSDLFEEE